MDKSFSESLIKRSSLKSTYIGHFQSSTSKENIYYKKVRPNVYKGDLVYHIVIVHDLFEYHMRHQKILKYLKTKLRGQLEITWIDLKGHGMSSGTRSHIDSFSEYTEDLLNLLNSKDLTTDDKLNRKNILFGHGLGGMIILDLLMNYQEKIDRQIDGLILSNPDIFFKANIPSWATGILNSSQSLLGPMRIPSLVKGSEINKEIEQSEFYQSDPLINHFCSLSLVNQIIKKSKEVKSFSYFIEYPTLFLLSQNDLSSDYKKIEVFAKGMLKHLKKLIVYPGAMRELTNGNEEAKVFKDIISWLKATF